MKLHRWLISRSGLDEYLIAEDFETEVAVAAFEKLLDAVDTAIEQVLTERDLALLVQLHDDLTYWPVEIVSLVRAAREGGAQ